MAALLAAMAAAVVAGAAGAGRFEDQLFDLQMIPLDAQTPPPLKGEGLDGRPVSLADFRGRLVLVYFWASW